MASKRQLIGPLTLQEQIDKWEKEPRLSAEEGWELIFSLFGSAKDLYAAYGGGEACLKAERAGWGEDDGDRLAKYRRAGDHSALLRAAEPAPDGGEES